MISSFRGTMVPMLVLVFTFSLFLAGCSSKPDAERLQQLSTLKDETAALQREVASKEAAKAALERDAAQKNTTLKKCSDDQQIVKGRLAK